MNKQIEEMAKIMCAGCLENETLTCSYDANNMPCRWAKYFAHTLYNAGYRKVNDDEVVLSISDVEEFRKDQAEVKFLKKQIQEQTRKETAREILKPLYEKALNSPDYTADYHISDIQELAKEFGVEVE